MNHTTTASEVHILALVKGDERYVLYFHPDRTCQALQTLGQWAANPELSFTWFDLAVLSKRMRDMQD